MRFDYPARVRGSSRVWRKRFQSGITTDFPRWFEDSNLRLFLLDPSGYYPQACSDAALSACSHSVFSSGRQARRSPISLGSLIIIRSPLRASREQFVEFGVEVIDSW